MTYNELPYLFQYRLTRAERNTLGWLAATCVLVVGVFSSFFALGLSIPLWDWRIVLGVALTSGVVWAGFGWVLVLRKLNRVLVTPVGLEIRHQAWPLRSYEQWAARELSAVGLVQAEDGGWELGLFGTQPGQYAFRRFYFGPAEKDILAALEEFCEVHRIRFLATRAEYAAFVNQTGILHDMP
jgi:hypothetical protein